MALFRCNNTNCDMKDKLVSQVKVKWTFDNISQSLKHDFKCSSCGEMMEYIDNKKEGDINVYFASFNAKSTEQKKEILKKRAHLHNKTKMKDRIPEVRKRILGQS